jgi:hypothetical protein
VLKTGIFDEFCRFCFLSRTRQIEAELMGHHLPQEGILLGVS